MLSSFVGCQDTATISAKFPKRPIKVVVPFAAGGGSDTFGRIIQNAVEKNNLLPQPLVIVNVPGAGGTIGSRRVKNAEPDGYTLLLLHEGIMTAKHSGNAMYGPEAFEPIAGTGDATQVIAVAGDSPFGDLESLMKATGERDDIVYSANIGAPSHFAGLMLEATTSGAKFRYTQNGGGAKRFAALQGGHVQVTSFSISEYVQFSQSGIRALALLGEKRNEELPDLPTAAELGFDVISQNMQFWWAPKGTPENRTRLIADALTKAMQTQEVKERLSEMMMSPVALTGNDLADEVQKRDRRIAAVATSENVILPNFPLIVLIVVVMLALVSLFQSPQAKDLSSDKGPEQNSKFSLIAIGFSMIGYVASMQYLGLGFVPATSIFVMICAGVLVRPKMKTKQLSSSRAVVILCVIALSMSVVTHHVFTKILVVDLP